MLSLHMPLGMVYLLDLAVERGIFANRSEVIRHAIPLLYRDLARIRYLLGIASAANQKTMIVSFHLTDKQLAMLDDIVAMKIVKDRSEAIRFAILLLLLRLADEHHPSTFTVGYR